jgi:hypothetical protein
MLFGSITLLSAFLLFQLQLVVAKQLLPWFGGTPSVWTTSQMFFQVVLLGGYAYAHVLTQSLRTRLQARVHFTVLLAASVAVITFPAFGGEPLLAQETMKPAGTDNPVLRLFLILIATVGLPFFAVSTTGPLLQRWHSQQSKSLSETYRLYALSNVGSFIGLLSYPFGIERLLDLTQQAWLWAVLFIVFAAGCGVITWRFADDPDTSEGVNQSEVDFPEGGEPTVARTRPASIVLWLLLAFVSSVMFLATTNQLSQDVAAVPFLWVLPLSIYLLTFIICFDRPEWYSRRWMSIATVATGVAVMMSGLGVLAQIASYGSFLFCFCMLCHGELVRLRPGARHLTLFYLLVALGGALGGIFVSIVAPAVFPDLWEFHTAIVAGWLLIGFAWLIDKNSPFHTGDRWFFASLVAIAAWLALRYLIERTPIGRVGIVSAYGWPVTSVVTFAFATGVSASFWKSPIVRLGIWPQIVMLLMVSLSATFLLQRIEASRDHALYVGRNFYGVIRVVSRETLRGDVRQLLHGTTTHGVQINVPGYRNTPTAYYSRSSGLATAVDGLARGRNPDTNETPRNLHFGIIGMGIGTVSAYALPGDRVRYYEVNPEVIATAQGPQSYFTFVRDSAAATEIVVGDARLSLERELTKGGSQRFDILVLDAFSSDSVPVHLLTAEAFRVYAAHLKSDRSILAMNVTNRYLDLEPVVAASAQSLGFRGVRVDSADDPPLTFKSSWVLFARDPHVFEHPSLARGRPLGDRLVQFTDKYSNLFRVLK